MINGYTSDGLSKQLKKQHIQADSDTVLEWLRQYKLTGEMAYRDLVFQSTLKWVIVIAQKYARKANASGHLEELIQEGNIGVLEAIEKFELEQFDNSFLTYADIHIKKRIFSYLSDNLYSIRVPKSLYYKFRKLKTEYAQDPESLDEHSLQKLCELRKIYKDAKTVSLGEPISGGSGKLILLGDTIPNDFRTDQFIEELHSTYVVETFRKMVLEIFPEEQANLFFSLMGWDDGKMKTIAETANMFGVPKWRVESSFKRISRSSALRLFLYENRTDHVNLA